MIERLLESIDEIGLVLEGLPETDGRIHRCRVNGRRGKPGWYVFHEVNDKVFGAFGDWATDTNIPWKNGGNGGNQLSREELDAVHAAVEASRRERERTALKAAKKAREMISETVSTAHPYLDSKGIKGAASVFEGKIIVPMYGPGGNIVGAQTIDTEGKKRFIYGTRKKGACCPLSGDDSTVCICEGWATGKTINEAVGCKVLVAFDAGNLMSAAKTAVRMFRDSKIIIAADNDQWRFKDSSRPEAAEAENTPKSSDKWKEWRKAGLLENIGLVKAGKISEKLGINFIAPPDYPELEGTDFNDLAAEKGIDAVKKALPRQESGIEILTAEELEKKTDFTLHLPSRILDPGGKISECMNAMRKAGLPNIPQYNFPVVLATISRAISGKITAEAFWPNLYIMKVGPTSSGKSSSDKFMKSRIVGKIEGFYGPSDFASGPALLRALADQPSALIVLDEATKMFRHYKGGNNSNLDEKKDVLMELHSNTG